MPFYAMTKFHLLTILSLLLFCNFPSEAKQFFNGQHQGFFPGAGGINLYYQFAGKGADTIVIIHGGPGMDAGYMIADFETLANKHVLLFYDQRGGGRSELPDTGTIKYSLHIDRHIEDLEALRNYFSFTRMTVLGHSFGTIIAGKYAIAYPANVKRMILIGAVPPYAGDFGARYDKALSGVLSKEEITELNFLSNEIINGSDPVDACSRYWAIALKPRIAAGLPISVLKGNCCSAPAAAIRYGYRYTQIITFDSLGDWDFREGLKKVTAPTLLIHGDEEAIPMDMVEEWTKYLPKSELIKIAKAAHFPYAERPSEVWPRIENFLRSTR